MRSRKARPSLDWTFERGLRPVPAVLVAGVDEAGRGCWAGPVYAAAVILPDGFTHPHLRDSKLLPPAAREELSTHLRSHAGVAWAIGVATVEEIETHNILRAALLAMRRAVEGLPTAPQLGLIDGNQRAGLTCAERTVVDGDALCPSIAAASVLAKVARDRAMGELAALYPLYGLENHKGYGTPEHARALALHGPCPVHRRGFRPVREHAHAAAGRHAGDRALR
jgi:ribonuclease HII